MRGLCLVLAAGVCAAAFAARAADFTPPPRKPGLWKMTMASSHAGKGNPPMTMSMCLDANVDKAMSVMSSGVGKQTCSSQSMNRTPAGYQFASVCSMGAGGTIKSSGVITGDFNKAYHMDVNGTVSGAAMAAMNGASHTTIDAAWSGPCPAGQRPGDMVMPGGMKINMMDASSAMARTPRRPHP